ncbi:Cullin family-domain-containing protein [Absidia repens]|uniref:Cullin family-domain-containing protein n=1 Tax=Absidia repens TaxID=90262 RepID=A0A1X2IRM3_9FUNG|nr:Cullin family-domain-containing protein [Absidia repens]
METLETSTGTPRKRSSEVEQQQQQQQKQKPSKRIRSEHESIPALDYDDSDKTTKECVLKDSIGITSDCTTLEEGSIQKTKVTDDNPCVNTLPRPIKSLLSSCQVKSDSHSIVIQYKNGDPGEKIPIEKTIPGYPHVFGIYIDHAFDGIDSGMSSQAMYEIISYACRSGDTQKVFDIIYDSLCANATKFCLRLESMASTKVDFLSEWLSEWNNYQKILTKINDVYSEVNHYYIIKKTQSSSFLHLGKQVTCDMLSQNIKIKTRMVLNIIYLIKCERCKAPTNSELILSALRLMYEDLPVYIPYFEHELIRTTKRFYCDRSSDGRRTLTIENYIGYAISLILSEPISKSEYRRFLFKTAVQPTDIAVDELLLKDMGDIVEKGFDYLIELRQDVLLQALYKIVSRYNEIDQIQSAFGQYIKDKCEKLCQEHIITDPDSYDRSPDSKSRSMLFVTSLLQLKSRMNSIYQECFCEDTAFQRTMKDSFEVAINLYQASSAQHIACYLDHQLESPWPFTPSVNQSLDDGIGLIRTLQAEDIFKCHYQTDLARRLLHNQDPNTVKKDICMAKRLKAECGAIFIEDIEVMINDIKTSQKQASRFKEMKRLESVGSGNQIDMNVSVLTSASWSLRPWTQNIKLPLQLLKNQQLYQKFHQQENPRRQLNWVSSLGTCVIEATYPKCSIQLVTTQNQALILLLFNDTGIQSLSVKEICQQTGIGKNAFYRYISRRTGLYFLVIINALYLDEKHIKKSLKRLSCQETPLLIKQQHPHRKQTSKTQKLVANDLFSYNTLYHTTQQLIEIQNISTELTSSTLKNISKQSLFTQKEKAQASIMRALKHHRRLSMDELQALVISTNKTDQKGSSFDSDLITSQLDDLVQRGFVRLTECGQYEHCE